jgi:hypothetical protein
LPPYWARNLAHSGHQLPLLSVAPANHASAVFGRALPLASFTQWLRLPLDAGLMTPAICPDAPSTKRLFFGFLGLSSSIDANAASHGTMWSSLEP